MAKIEGAISANQIDHDAEAEALCRSILEVDCRNFDALNALGTICSSRRQFKEAEHFFREAITVDPKSPLCYLNYGNLLTELSQFMDAIIIYNNGIAIEPEYYPLYSDRGNAQYLAGLHDEALESYERAVAFKPDLAPAWLGRGNILLERGQYNDSLAAYDIAISSAPDLAQAWLGRGNVCLALKEFDDALKAFDRALTLVPEYVEAWCERGRVLFETGQFKQSFIAYDKAFNLQPDHIYAQGHRLQSKLSTCDWTNLEADVTELRAGLRAQRFPCVPFSLLCIQASASEKLQYARRYIAALPTFAKLWRGEVYSHDRIRVAYVSTDFHPHPVSYCMAGLFELHDKSRFETTAISLGPAENCELRYRLQCAFERFIDVRFERDLDIAELIQHLEIDILVDLNGHTGNSRPNIFSRRPAPIQVNYLGFMGTTGADYMDYIIADSTVVPEDQLEFYTEKVVWLPDSFMATDRCLLISETTPTRAESGLPELGFVFCCFNNTFKIMPVLFAIWMRLLRNTPDSVLWLIEVDPIASANLRTEAERHGIHSDRLIFSPRVNLAEHLARQKNADLFP